MSNQTYRGLAVIYQTTKKLCKYLTIFLPGLLPFIPEPEKSALLALQIACTDLLNQGVIPGTDNDPGTPT